MSFNLNTKVNNLQWQINQIVAGSVTNPLTSNLNANNKSITNCNTLSSVSGSPLNLSAGASTVNVASAVNMVDTLTINNNTVHNGLVVSDSAGDTSCFVIDQSGNCGIKVNPVDTLTTDFVVNGSASISGSCTVNTLNATTINGGNILNNITAGTGLIKTGTSTNPTLSNTGVLGVSAGSSGISVSGTAQNPVINNTGVTQLTAGSNISLSGSTGNITISALGAGWIPTATSALNMSNYQIDNVGAGSSATDAPNIGQIQNACANFSPATNLWNNGVNFWFSISSSMPSGQIKSGILWYGTPSNLSSGIYPPAIYEVAFCIPLSTSSTPSSPGTNWIANSPVWLRVQLENRNFGSNVVNTVFDSKIAQGMVYVDNGTNTPFLCFNTTLVAGSSSPCDNFGNGNKIGMSFSIAGDAYGGASYSFNPSGSVGTYEYLAVNYRPLMNSGTGY